MPVNNYKNVLLKSELMQLATQLRLFDTDKIVVYYKELLYKDVKKEETIIDFKIDHAIFCSLLYSFIVSWLIRKDELHWNHQKVIYKLIEIIHNSYIDETLFAKELLEHDYLFSQTKNGFANIAFHLLPASKESKEIIPNHMERLKNLQYFIDKENGYFSLFIKDKLFYVHNFSDTYRVINFEIFDIDANDEEEFIACPTAYCQEIDRILIKPLLGKVNDANLHGMYILKSLEDR